jgi:hypothetical protein
MIELTAPQPQLEGMRKVLKEEVWHIYYGRYEHAILMYKQDGEGSQRVKDKLNKVADVLAELHVRVSHGMNRRKAPRTITGTHACTCVLAR